MNARRHAMRVGAARGRTEFGLSLRAPQDVGYYLVTSAALLVVLYLNRDSPVEGSGLTLSSIMFPGLIAMFAVIATFSVASVMAVEKEDGTLLRAKATPHGLVGYVTGQVVRVTLEVIFSVAIVLIGGALIIDQVMANGAVGWLSALGFGVLGLLACIPLGIVIGSLFKNPRSVGGWGMLIIGGLIAISGIFSPIASFAGWLQGLAQVFPVYWVGLGMRWSFLPPEAATIELTQSFRPLLAVAVLVAWIVIGNLLAPVVLRRMARREGGSDLQSRREKALQRV